MFPLSACANWLRFFRDGKQLRTGSTFLRMSHPEGRGKTLGDSIFTDGPFEPKAAGGKGHKPTRYKFGNGFSASASPKQMNQAPWMWYKVTVVCLLGNGTSSAAICVPVGRWRACLERNPKTAVGGKAHASSFCYRTAVGKGSHVSSCWFDVWTVFLHDDVTVCGGAHTIALLEFGHD